MKRFYASAGIISGEEGGHGVALDGRPIRTPAKNLLVMPSRLLAEAVAAEWDGQGEKIDPRSMPFTGLANAAIDQIAPDTKTFARSVSSYGESDLLCYRAEGPTALVQAQIREWNPLLDWAEGRFQIAFRIGQGVMHVPQPATTIAALDDVVAALDPFRLAALSTLVTMSGSLVCGLAALHRAFDTETVWRASELDELWQAEQWGRDEQAEQLRSARGVEFHTAARFLVLLDET